MSFLMTLLSRKGLLDRLWYGRRRWWHALLFPFSMLFSGAVVIRRCYLQWFFQQMFSVPIIVVGNITVGGVGKTPLVLALAKEFTRHGLRVGIVSRGYGSHVGADPYEVHLEDHADVVGDEPLLLAKRAGCPVVIAPQRTKAVQYLLDIHQSQIIISDDGLQHYAMGRAIEIVVMDGLRGLGNGFFLPAGPLREGACRLKSADFIVINGELSSRAEVSECVQKMRAHHVDTMIYGMEIQPGEFTQVMSGKTMCLSDLESPVAAVAAIGHPQRFFATLDALGLPFHAYAFPDHYSFQKNDLERVLEKTVVMTEKDAVKCLPFATDRMYFLPVEAKVDDIFWQALWSHKQLQGYVEHVQVID
jgi:tetraacyldisaccharide 4'-kinase